MNYKLYIHFFGAKLLSWAIYSSALLLFISDTIISSQIQYLIFIELFYGMLLYPLKISIIKDNSKKFSFFMWAIFLSLIGLLYSFYIFPYNLSFFIVLLSLVIFPYFVLVNASGDQKHIDSFVISENISAILSSMICFFIFYFCNLLGSEDYITILYRSIITTFIIIFINIKHANNVIRFNNYKIKFNIIEIVSGIDYLLLCYFLKSTFFKFIAIGNYDTLRFPPYTAKLFTIIYDPLAAIIGLALRRLFIFKGHENYVAATKKHFLLLAYITITALLTSLFFNKILFLSLALFFIYFSALSNTVQLISHRRRLILLSVVLCTTLCIKLECIPIYLFILIPIVLYAISFSSIYHNANK